MKYLLRMMTIVFLVGGGPGHLGAQQNVHSFEMADIYGQKVSLSDYQGKALLIVNTASLCGRTPQYASLEKLYEAYHAKGFEVLAFPANNFKNQEPGTNEEIKQFCSLKYHVTFPLFSKIDVAGEKIDPLYAYLTQATKFPGAIEWNFAKFLVSPSGEVVGRFHSKVDPLDPEVISAIESVLPKT